MKAIATGSNHLLIKLCSQKAPGHDLRASLQTVAEPHQPDQKHGQGLHLPRALSNILHLNLTSTPLEVQHHFNRLTNNSDQRSPTSPQEVIASKWHEIHGSADWENLLDPFHPWLRREIVKYGEFAQATYDGFDFDAWSEYSRSCRYNPKNLFNELGLGKNGYIVSRYIYAMSHVELPRWLERSHLLDVWSKDSNWMGYVAASNDDESKRIGRRDIVVAWRGTVAPSEWLEDVQGKLEPIGDGDMKVEHGFLSIYTSKSDSTRYNKYSASEQAMKEVTRLVTMFREIGEEVSLTITGHSLGGALALLNAYESATSLPGLPISVISFGAPRVGNAAFKEKLQQLQVKTLRVVNKQDLVPRMPGLMFNEGLQKFEVITGPLQTIYTHVGVELKLNTRASPYLKQGLDLPGVHSLETYLHLVDGFLSSTSSFRVDARRDVTLVNKASGMLVNELRIPESWYQVANKGLIRNSHGRWVKPQRDQEDIPSPSADAPTLCLCRRMERSKAMSNNY